MKRRVWVLPGVAMTILMSLNIIDFQLMTFSIVLLSGPNNYVFICFWGDLDLKTPPVKFLFNCTYYIINIQKEHIYPYTQIFVCAISGKKILTWKKNREQGEVWKASNESLMRGSPACSVIVLDSGKPACISRAYAAVTMATLQKALLGGTLEWQPIGLPSVPFQARKLIFSKEWKLQSDCNHVWLGFPRWFMFLSISG